MSGMRAAALAAALVVTPVLAGAQTVGVTAGVGFNRLWDDETNLGSGVVVAGGVTAGLGEHVDVSATVDRAGHSRSLTYLGVDGAALGVVGRGSYLFGGRTARVTPIMGAGVGVMHSSGTLRTANPVALGVPGVVPMVETPWSLTRPMWEALAGLRIRSGSRLTVQPELRWRSTWGASDVRNGIEPPLLGVAGLMTIEWKVR